MLDMPWAPLLQAFIWWQSTGTESKSGNEDTLYGLNLLRINSAGKIHSVRFTVRKWSWWGLE